MTGGDWRATESATVECGRAIVWTADEMTTDESDVSTDCRD